MTLTGHMPRRKFYDVHHKKQSPIAANGLRGICAIYDAKRDITGLLPDPSIS